MTFPKASTVSEVQVYWFDDTGRGEVRVPETWRLLYKDGDTWKPVEAAGPYGVERNKYNVVSFRPVTTTALRIELKMQPTWSAGNPGVESEVEGKGRRGKEGKFEVRTSKFDVMMSRPCLTSALSFVIPLYRSAETIGAVVQDIEALDDRGRPRDHPGQRRQRGPHERGLPRARARARASRSP